MSGYDLFLSYNSADGESVRTIQQILRVHGITTFRDRDNLVPGLPWPEALREALHRVRAVAVFIGPQLGGWQRRELYFALDRQVREERDGCAFPVVPILLPGADITPSFLFLNTWVDLRLSLTDSAAFGELVRVVCSTTPVERKEGAEPLEVTCPYRGLRPFREEDAAFFAGRDDLAARLLDLILSRNFVASSDLPVVASHR